MATGGCEVSCCFSPQTDIAPTEVLNFFIFDHDTRHEEKYYIRRVSSGADELLHVR